MSKFNKKPVSHFEVMSNYDLRKKFFPKVSFNIEEEYFEKGFEEVNGRVIPVTKTVKKKAFDRVKDYKVNDFALDTIQAIGATGTLKFSTIEGNIDDSLANIDSFMDSVGQLDSQE